MADIYRVVRAHQPEEGEPLVLREGEAVRFERRPTVWEGWLWCWKATGESGWVPEAWVKVRADECAVERDYSSFELAVKPGETLDAVLTESGWLLGVTSGGTAGWVPLECVELIALGRWRPAVTNDGQDVNVWSDFDSFMRTHEEQQRDTGAFMDEWAVKGKATFIHAQNLSQLVTALVLMGRRDEAINYAEQAEKFAEIAIERAHGFVGMGAKLSPDMSRGWMCYVLYLCRWLRSGREDRQTLRTAMAHAENVVREEEGKRRARFRQRNIAFLGGLAARLEMFDVAMEHVERSAGLVDWSFGGCSEEEYAALYARLVAYLASAERRPEERAAIVRALEQVFSETRAGRIPMRGLLNGNLESTINLSYFGLKHFEELRGGAPFTYDSVVRNIRHTNE